MPYSTKCIQLGGSRYITMGNVLGFERDEEFSLVAWIKAVLTSDGYICSKLTSSPFRGFGFVIESAGTVRFFVSNALFTNSAQVRTVSSGWDDGNWHMLAATYDGSSTAAGIRVFIDGAYQDVNVMNDSLTATILNTTSFNIGSRTDGSIIYNGKITQVSVHNRVLLKKELESIYNSGNPVSPKVLASFDSVYGYWPLGDGDVHPTAYERTLDPDVPMAAGTKSSYLQLRNDEVIPEWARGVSFQDMAVFYPGVGGTFSRFSTKFTPSSTYYRAGPILRREVDDPWSISFWVKYTDTGSEYREFVTRSTHYNRDGNYIIRPHYSSPGQIGLLMRGGNFVGFIEVYTTANTFNDGSWHHICVTYDGTKVAGGVHIWVDNTDEPLTIVSNSTLISLLNDSFNIGGYSDNGKSIDGYMAEVAMYGKELNSSEISAIYNSGVPNDLSGLSTANDLLAWWPMGSADGYQDRPGTLVNMESSNSSTDAPGGYLLQSFGFNGTDETISFDNAFNFERDQAFSISCYVKTSYAGGAHTIISKLDASFRGYEVAFDSTGAIYVEIASSTTNKIQVYTTSGGFNDGSWKHVVVTYSGTSAASGVAIYVNGSLQALTTGSDTLTTTIIDTAVLRVGSRSTDVQFWNGNITGVGIYCSQLSGADVTALYNSGTPVDPTTVGSNPYLVGFWRLGFGYSSGTMVNMSSGDILDDSPYYSGLSTEKTWTTIANYDLGGSGQDTTALGQLLLLDWKDRMVTAGWTVIGSGNTSTYEWQGVTSGPYDVWSSTSDIIWRDSDLGLGAVSWVTLESPVSTFGQFWITIAWYGPTLEHATVTATNSVPTLPGDPLNAYPVPSNEQWFWILKQGQFFNWFDASTAVKTYLSICSDDGSFVFCRRTNNDFDWNACQLFVASESFMDGEWPMRAVGLGEYGTFSSDLLEKFRFYLPEFPQDNYAEAVVDTYDISNIADDLFTEDSISGETPAASLVLVPRCAVEDSGGMQSMVCRVPDVFLSNRTIARGSMVPFNSPYLYTNFEGYLWIPGDTEPDFT